MRIGITIFIAIIATMLTGCATPGDQVKVPTMSVEAAWNHQDQSNLSNASGRVVNEATKQSRPYPVISAPDIRLAYIKSWIDQSGVRHYGNWVAIQVDGAKWLLPDGSLEPIQSPVRPATTTKPRG